MYNLRLCTKIRDEIMEELQTIEKVIERYLRSNPADGDLQRAFAILGKLREDYELLPKGEMEKLKQQMRELTEPPLQYAIYLGPSPSNERDIVVGVGSTRLEVHLADSLDIDLSQLIPGQEVVLNKEQNVVAIRDEYVRGETAEVVNILKPEGAAEVVAVLEEKPHRPLRVRVKWREGEEIEVECTEQLSKRGIRRGDIVQIDPDRMTAIARVRPRLHVRAGGSEGTVVEISDRLFEEGVQIGDIVRIEPGLKFAFEKLPSYETGELALEEVPDVTYDDIGGLDLQIEAIRDAIELPYLHRPLFDRYQLTRPKGILLYGPPGCGKTMVAKAVANNLTQSIREHLTNLERRIRLYMRLKNHPDDAESLREFEALMAAESTQAGHPQKTVSAQNALTLLEESLRLYDVDLEHLDEELREIRSVLDRKDGVRSFFLNIKGPELLDKYVGETEHRIRKIFEEARRHATYYTPVVVFFDEMEAMFRTRGTGRSSDVETTIVPQFLSEIDGVESTENVIIIGASNRHDMIDPAIMRPGRLDVKIKIDRPTKEAAKDIFALYLLPTLPLNPEGVTISPSSSGLGEVVFRTAYQNPRMSAEVQIIHELLPAGCDLRLALSLNDADLEALSRIPPQMTVRQMHDRQNGNGRNDDLWRKVQRFKAGTEIGEIVARLQVFSRRYREDPRLAAIVDRFIRQEWLAEAMIQEAVKLLYSPASNVSVLTRAVTRDGNVVSNRYVFPVKDFVSGAAIAGIVARAKKRAVKRAAVEPERAQQGIGMEDILESIREELEENKEQLALHKVQAELGRSGEEIQSVELHLETGTVDPWSEEKQRPYREAVLI
jgi:proteasome-associated ATPase